MKAWDKFNKLISDNKLISPFDRVLIAFSGGPDSVCLAHLIWRLKKVMPIEIGIVYFNHGLRKQAFAEERFSAGFAKKYGYEYFSETLNVKRYSGKSKCSLETSGRNLRYDGLFKISHKKKFNKIATGHNADDNAETMLMWMLRGTGMDGLTGIPLVRREKNKAPVVRAILVLSKDEIRQYNKEQKLKYFMDESNRSMEFTRNRIRHGIIPYLRGINKGFIDHFYKLSRIVSLENEYISEITEKSMKKCVKPSKNKILLDLSVFFKYNKVIQFRIIKSILPERRSNFNIERLIEWMLDSRRKELQLSRSLKAKRLKKRIVFLKDK